MQNISPSYKVKVSGFIFRRVAISNEVLQKVIEQYV